MNEKSVIMFALCKYYEKNAILCNIQITKICKQNNHFDVNCQWNPILCQFWMEIDIDNTNAI